jgi:hypothetical protein
MVAGSQVAHVFAFRLVYPQAQLRLRDLLATGHGYMLGRWGFVPLLLGVVAGLELVAFGWSIFGRASRDRRSRPLPPWAFMLMPLVGFTAQEFTERWLEGMPAPWLMVLEPTFRVGLLLQLPFGLAAFLLAWLLLRVAERVRRALRPATLPARACAPPILRSIPTAWVPGGTLLGTGHAGRGPPVLFSAPL